ncbi:FHA domain-containing protein [Spongisporangium articulatum]|uniref:FHA domain-containing protein n=1 Tax=Spongisporangium articulatum TaxID=3362603 RepID=A0ABW8AT46_9ACTN
MTHSVALAGSPQDIRRTVEAWLFDHGFASAPQSGSALTFVRRRRPAWSRIAAWALALPTVGSSLLLLLLRRTETVVCVIEPALSGARVHLSGAVPEELVGALRAGLIESVAPQALAPDTRAVPALRPLPPPAGEESTEVAGRRPGPAAQPRAYLIVPDWGPSVLVTGGGVMGRQPRAADGRLTVVVPDPDRRVSKEHADFGMDSSGFWITDRGSTNGTRITTVDGSITTCVAGRRHYVEVGQRVSLGNRRSFTVRPGTGED